MKTWQTKLVQIVRVLIYTAGIATAIFVTVKMMTKAKASETVEFWPPDMIPHPELPHPVEKERELV